MPLPPYIAAKRPPDAQDRDDYQTVYAREAGSVAAPTAGLHFTSALLQELAARGVDRADITLHVGAGTFLPVIADDIHRHVMHAERVTVGRRSGGPDEPGGPCRRRPYWWRWARRPCAAWKVQRTRKGRVHPLDGETENLYHARLSFSRRGYALVTNFSSALFHPVHAVFAAFTRPAMDAMKPELYAEAIAQGYRFYSYGDACLLFGARA